MSEKENLKLQVNKILDERAIEIIDIAKRIAANPEPGYKEYKTAKLVQEEFDKLHNLNTVFQSDIFAIHRAASILLDFGPQNKNIFIFSDSQASLKALDSADSNSRTVINCYQSLTLLGQSNTITLSWVPGHEGHVGNEWADKLANKGANKPTTSISPPPLPFSHIKQSVQKHYKNRQLRHWYGNLCSEHCKSMLNPILELGLDVKKVLITLSSEKLSTMVKLITGHNQLNYFQHKIGNSGLNTCEYCDVAMKMSLKLRIISSANA